MRNARVRALLIPALVALSAVAQDKGGTNLKTLHLFPSRAHDPVEITKLMKGSTEIQPDVPFEAGDDWLSEISVAIRNISTSRIVYVSVGAHLPETGAGTRESPRVGGGNAVGRKPEHAMYSVVTGQRRQESPNEAVDLEQGKELVVPLIAERDYATIKSLIRGKQAVSSVRNCDIWVTTVYFADGTKWAPANYWRPDEATPGRYVSIPFADWMNMQHPHQDSRTSEK